MDIVSYEYDRGFVLESFRKGEFDYVDAANEVTETEFFRYIDAEKLLEKMAETYPSPREKEEVPTWFYVTSNLSMRLHGVHAFHAYPYVIRCGGMLNAFGPQIGRKTTHPETGDVTLNCEGFNAKNAYDRQTPCDQDFLRKFARDTDAQALEGWFNGDIVRILKENGVFDEEGIFIGDASYLFVPDNPAYEGSALMLFDESDHPVDPESVAKMSPKQATRYRWRRCYKLVSLIHTNRACDFFLYVSLRVLPGKAHECPILYELVDGFAEAAGKGVMKRLILDRGFIDGAKIGRCKLQHEIDVLIPLRKNMDVYQDALRLLSRPEVKFAPYTPVERKPPAPPRTVDAPEHIRKRERKRQETLRARKAADPPPEPPPDKVLVRSEVAGIEGFQTWESCPVPLTVIVNREVYADGHKDYWMLVDTKPLEDAGAPAAKRDEFGVRTAIEERHRQLKCFWDLTQFTSRTFSLVFNQVVFVALAYTLLQLFLWREKRREMTTRTRPRVRDYLLPNDSVILIYYKNRYATVTPLEYTELLVTLGEVARRKIRDKTRRLRRQLLGEMTNPRPP